MRRRSRTINKEENDEEKKLDDELQNGGLIMLRFNRTTMEDEVDDACFMMNKKRT